MDAAWPSLPFDAWKDTCATLHMWTQIVGKIRLARAPLVNHYWQAPLYVTARGLTTSPIPHGARSFEVRFDFVDHVLRIEASDGAARVVALRPRSVADFYGDVMTQMADLGLATTIWPRPVEVETRIPFDRDETHAAYDAEYAHRFWQALVHAERVLTAFRARFLGKASPVHFFWGGFDLAVTRFSGRPAPEHPGAPNVGRFVMVESYSHEVSSCGFWPGGGAVTEPMFYAYAYPEPAGFKNYPVGPAGASYSRELGEFLLPYDVVRQADRPDAALMQFLQSTYEAAATLGAWDRAALERAVSA